MRSLATQEEVKGSLNVIREAERCRREALDLVKKSPKYEALLDQPSGWCVAVEKGWWSRTFCTMLQEDQLREKLERGYRAIVTVGLVAAPGVPLTPKNHSSVLSVAEPRKYNADKLSDIGIRAKVNAAAALHR